MAKNRVLLGLLVSLMLTGVLVFVTPVHPAVDPGWPVLLDANSISATDTLPQAAFSPVKTFNVGLILEANSTTPMPGVFGWEVSIIYDNSTVVPQGDPTVGSATDGAAPTITFGTMATAGQVNLAGKIAAAAGFGS